jgi:hypothetical protein
VPVFCGVRLCFVAAVTCHCCRGEAELSGVWAKFLVLGLGLLFLGKQEVVEPTLEVRRTKFVPCVGPVGVLTCFLLLCDCATGAVILLTVPSRLALLRGLRLQPRTCGFV